MLGDNIRKYRKEKNLSQDELAEKLNVTRQSVSLWENDQTQPSLESIIAMSKLFGVTTDDLLTGENGEAPLPSAPKAAPDEPMPGNGPSPKKRGVLIGCIAGAVILIGLILFFALRSCSDADKPDTSPDASLSSAVPSDVTSKPGASSGQAMSSGASEAVPSDSEPASEEPSEKPSEKESEVTSSEAASSEAVSEPQTSDKSSEKAEEPSEKASEKTSEKTSEKPKKDDPPKEDPPKTSEKEGPVNLFEELKEFVVEKGTLNGDYCCYYNYADYYGGDPYQNFSLYYWGDSDTVEFCLHGSVNETFSISYTLRIPKNPASTVYDYITSYYYRSDGMSAYEARGTIDASKFTKNYPLVCSSYYGDTDTQNDFMEISRLGLCDLLDCLKQFIVVEKLGYSFTKDFGFTKF